MIYAPAVPKDALSFSRTLDFLMGRLGTQAVVAVGTTDHRGPPVVATLAGTLMIVEDEALTTTTAPVTFSFAENESTFTLDPSAFVAAYASSAALSIEMGPLVVEVFEPPESAA